jgi:nicotinamidase/pyrazinamidase
MSHCVNYTLRDIVDHWPKDQTNKITLLKDCASSVPGFEAAAETFVNDMIGAGVVVESSENAAV